MDIAETTKALADIFRYSISKKGQIIPFKNEIANIDAYMKIQKTRFGDRFSLVKEIDEDVYEIPIPKLIVQPIVENAIVHGLEQKSGGGLITFNAYLSKKAMVITIKDNGKGIDDEKLERINETLRGDIWVSNNEKFGDHVGLVNVNERVKMLYGDEYGVYVKSMVGVGTEVIVTLAVNTSIHGEK